MSRAPAWFRLTAWLAPLALGLAPAQAPYNFENYPARENFKGPAAKPKLLRPEERRFRTVITRGVAGQSPNFAGRFIIVQWGCGTDCVQSAIVDARTGVIYKPPDVEPREFGAGFLTFRADSRLMLNDTNCDFLGSYRCDRDYYVWENFRFRHLRHVPRGAPLPY